MASTTVYRIISARISPMVELTRWLFERQGLAFREEAHVLGFHALATLPAKGGLHVPVIVTPDGAVWKTARDILEGLDAAGPPGRRLLGEKELERTTNHAFVERLLTGLLADAPRHVYQTVLPFKDLAFPAATHRAPGWERALVWLIYPVWRGMMTRSLGSAPAQLAEAAARIEATFVMVEAELARRGSAFLGGESPGVLDIVFSALAALLVFPPNHGARLPPFSALPPTLKAFVAATRTRPAGALVLRTYLAARRHD